MMLMMIKHRIFAMFAKKNIKTGTEITTSYSDPNDEEDKKLKKRNQDNDGSLGLYMPCKCGAPNCRGIMFS
jgi:SET domain-containing protein